MLLSLYRPSIEDLWFKQLMMADERTMSYNHDWGGTISFPRERWQEWFDRWIVHHENLRFYRYLKDEFGRFIGEISYHYDGETDGYMCDVVIYADHRGKGYGSRALEMLCSVAGEHGISVLYDSIAIDNPAVHMFLNHGFSEVSRVNNTILLMKTLE